MKSKKINERKKRRKKKDIRYIVLSVLHELILFSRERTIIMAKKWQTKIKLEETRAEWDAQCKKQNKEDHEESRRKLQPARKPFDNGVRLTGSCMEKNAGLKRLLSIDGSHPYKDVPYESGDHTGRTEMQKYREFGVKKKRTVSIGESSNKAVLIEIPCSVLVPPPPPSLLLPPSNKFLSSISSSLAPSSILPSASASKGWSSRHERPRKEDPKMEMEDSKMRREKEKNRLKDHENKYTRVVIRKEHSHSITNKHTNNTDPFTVATFLVSAPLSLLRLNSPKDMKNVTVNFVPKNEKEGSKIRSSVSLPPPLLFPLSNASSAVPSSIFPSVSSAASVSVSEVGKVDSGT